VNATALFIAPSNNSSKIETSVTFPATWRPMPWNAPTARLQVDYGKDRDGAGRTAAGASEIGMRYTLRTVRIVDGTRASVALN
jgi:hypothetical protein